MSSAVVCIVMGSVVLISFMFCVWSCGPPPKTTQMFAPPPPGGWGRPLVILMFTMSFFGTLFKWSFGLFGGDIGCQY